MYVYTPSHLLCSYISLVSGTLRSNLDPFGNHDDARLWDALKRSYLVEDKRHPSIDLPDEDATLAGQSTPANRFSLDSAIEDEGGNLSVGQVCDLVAVDILTVVLTAPPALPCQPGSGFGTELEDPHLR